MREEVAEEMRLTAAKAGEVNPTHSHAHTLTHSHSHSLSLSFPPSTPSPLAGVDYEGDPVQWFGVDDCDELRCSPFTRTRARAHTHAYLCTLTHIQYTQRVLKYLN